MPSNIRVREFGTGKSRRDTARNLGIEFNIVPNIGRDDGIDAVRLILPRCWFDEGKCQLGLDALTFYRKAYHERSARVYGQVLKTRRNNRVVRVERRVKIGTANRLKAALLASEDSETLNTSFVERLNLTIRQASAYLRRRSPCHARDADQLRSHVELVRCHYNFVRPHRALRFGRETRTPAMQARLVSRRLALSDIFTGRLVTLRVFVAVVETAAGGSPPLSWSYEQRAAA